jgi:hypothetical protein
MANQLAEDTALAARKAVKDEMNRETPVTRPQVAAVKPTPDTAIEPRTIRPWETSPTVIQYAYPTQWEFTAENSKHKTRGVVPFIGPLPETTTYGKLKPRTVHNYAAAAADTQYAVAAVSQVEYNVATARRAHYPVDHGWNARIKASRLAAAPKWFTRTPRYSPPPPSSLSPRLPNHLRYRLPRYRGFFFAPRLPHVACPKTPSTNAFVVRHWLRIRTALIGL